MRALLAAFAAAAFLLVLLRSADPARAAGPPDRPVPPKSDAGAAPICISGVYPSLAALSDGRSECGIGAVWPWANRLWFVTYPAHLGDGRLWQVDRSLRLRLRPESAGGTHASRAVHAESDQLIIGPYFIDRSGRVRVIRTLASRHRLTGCMRHLTHPAEKVYFLTMEGLLFEADVRSLEFRLLDDVRKSLGIRGRCHFKGGFTAQGRVLVANNSYDASDQARGRGDGRLAEWDGAKWTIVERTAFCDVTDGGSGETVYATGWDRRSVILKVRADGRWHTFRLPKASQCFDHAWCTEWPRIRRVAPGKLLMDFHGMFYELSPAFAPGRAGGLRPICTHLRMVPDFCTWRGRLVLASDDNSFLGNPVGGQPQSNLWFGGPAELETFGRPAGWGGPWLGDPVGAGAASDPFLIGGFEKRVVHLAHDAAAPVTFALETDADGSGQWREYLSVTVPRGGSGWHVFPAGLAARWVRVTTDRDCKATVQFLYTSPGGPAGGDAARAGAEKMFRGLAGVGASPARVDGALLPWAGRLWFVANRTGADGAARAGGLYELDQDMALRRRDESVEGIFSNRLMVGEQLLIGPHLIDRRRRVRTLKGLAGRHVTAAMRHPTAKGKVVLLTREGELLTAETATLEVRSWFNLRKELKLAGEACFQGGYTSGKTMIVAAAGPHGCLAQWNGREWSVVQRAAFFDVARTGAMSPAVLAIGCDEASAILKVRLNYKWSTYRLPKAAGVPCDPWAAGRPRVREVQTERLLLDCGGIFYEMPELLYGGKVCPLKPLAAHGKRISDFCSWRGLLVLAGVDPTAAGDGHCFADRDRKAALWFGKTDDLWRIGRAPAGAGGPWRNTAVEADRPSDPYLMTGFNRKTLELSHDAGEGVRFTVEVDFVGTGAWKRCAAVDVPPRRTHRHQFPDGFSAHWVRLRASRNCRATATFLYE